MQIHVYKSWDFTAPPFLTKPLPCSAIGNNLLVGRERELKGLSHRLLSSASIPTIEGMNGLGKTSLVNVAVYRSFDNYLRTGLGPFLIPCQERFQLLAGIHLDQFIDDIYFAIAQTLIEKRPELKRNGKNLPNSGVIDRWLNLAESQAVHASFAGIGAGHERAPYSPVYQRSGFKRQVKAWLKHLFPEPGDGGMVCIIDNIELLRNSTEARRNLEALRDPLDSIPRVRWVICGSRGIVQGIARSPRLQGYLQSPLKIRTVKSVFAMEILKSRTETFKRKDKTPYLPFTPENFAIFYNVMGGNIRAVLSGIDDYCIWIADAGKKPLGPSEKSDNFKSWIREVSADYYENIRRFVQPRTWKIFDLICKRNGKINLKEFNDADVSRQNLVRMATRELSEAGALSDGQSGAEPDDEIFYLTSKGWLVKFARGRGDLGETLRGA